VARNASGRSKRSVRLIARQRRSAWVDDRHIGEGVAFTQPVADRHARGTVALRGLQKQRGPVMAKPFVPMNRPQAEWLNTRGVPPQRNQVHHIIGSRPPQRLRIPRLAAIYVAPRTPVYAKPNRKRRPLACGAANRASSVERLGACRMREASPP
jgi:hypothetical protein